jgi:putative ABC transport system permease protein
MGRVIIASVSVMFAVAVVTGMIGITAGINEKLGSELKAYGANIIIAPQLEDYLDADVLRRMKMINDIDDAAGQLYGNVIVKDQTIEFIGLDMERVKSMGWKLTGRWPEAENEVLAGINIKNALDLEQEKTIQVVSQKKFFMLRISGFIEKGGAEDNVFIIPLASAWNMTGLHNKLSAVLIRGKPEKLDAVVGKIKAVITGTTVKTIRQVALAEKSFLNKIQLLMLLVTVVVLFATIISIGSTMGANVLERREDIGLMKAIGATRSEISIFYRVEAIIIGLIGGIAGYVLGYIAAQAISQGAFDSFIAIPFYMPVVSISIGVIISLFASYFPVRDALKYNPAVILRGE